MKVFIYILFVTGVTFLMCAFLYLKFGLCKRLFHDCFGWHKPEDENNSEFDGYNLHNKCKYCGKEIVQDSQGNWFEI